MEEDYGIGEGYWKRFFLVGICSFVGAFIWASLLGGAMKQLNDGLGKDFAIFTLLVLMLGSVSFFILCLKPREVDEVGGLREPNEVAGLLIGLTLGLFIQQIIMNNLLPLWTLPGPW